MRVSELAGKAGVTPAAVRFYEHEGFLPAPPRAANGYRRYSAEDVCRLRVLSALRGLGVDLPEASRLAVLSVSGSDESNEQLLSRLSERRAEVARARAELDHLEAELANLERALATGQACELLCRGKEECC